ncbi:PhzF family phenazine biosynthesis protein [Amorphus sp. 3PC139-8]|uniref:PhzF family phenazine biosynthesis protein n=1 Tax=Amorphus sp. 3PC139-8 TaxID=2735676 RepID=UPI00345DD4D7
MDRRYAVLDVFTDQALSGNQLAVVRDAAGLSDDAMQAIAKEFNLSETVFVLPPENPAHTARVRIFTPAKELPFAGHPTVGTAVLLGSDRLGQSSDLDAVVVLEEKIGLVRCGVAFRSTSAAYAEFDLPRLPQVADSAPGVEAVADVLGLAPHEIGFGHFPIAVSGVGFPYMAIPVNGLDAIRRAAPRMDRWDTVFSEERGYLSAYLYTAEVERPDATYHTRMFAPAFGIVEDPATGSAAAAFAGILHRYGQLTSGSHRFLLEQGIEMGRPSLIALEVDVAEDGALHAARIGGSAVLVAEGMLKV